MDFRQRFQSKLSKAVELSGEEVPISKELKSSQLHEQPLSSFRTSAYSVLGQMPLGSAYLGGNPPLVLTNAGSFGGNGGNSAYPPLRSDFPTANLPSFYHSPPQWLSVPQTLPQNPQFPLYPSAPSSRVPFNYSQSVSPSLPVQTPIPTLQSYSATPFSSQPYSKPQNRVPADVPQQLLVSHSTETLQPVAHSFKRRVSPAMRKSAEAAFKSKLQQARKAPAAAPVPVEIPYSKKRDVDFSPYTYDDYVRVKQDVSRMRLGGLGPVNVNTQEWRDQTRRRVQASLYGKVTRARNAEEGKATKSFDF